MDISIGDLELFLLVLVRILSIVMLMPMFGYPGIPRQAKIGLGVCLSLLLFPIVQEEKIELPSEVLSFFLVVGKEVVVGLVIGFATALLFTGIQLSGQLVGMQMGFGLANVIDPQSGMQVSIIAQFEYLVAILMFLVIDGHHFLLRALKASFERIPIAGVHLSGAVAWEILRITAWVFVVAIKIGAPMIAALFLTKVALGIVARTVPQMNVFIVGFPLNIGIGLLSIALSLPLFAYVFKWLFREMQENVLLLLRLL